MIDRYELEFDSNVAFVLMIGWVLLTLGFFYVFGGWIFIACAVGIVAASYRILVWETNQLANTGLDLRKSRLRV